jgi:acyl-CoA synthetase (AMP-forming)/AMP-acid ligase II
MSMMLYPEDHALGMSSQPQVLTSTGKPLPWVDVRVVDESGHDVVAGQPGELVIRSDFRFDHYWHNPAQTEEVLRDGWIYTGDIGFIDDDGYVYLNDRAKFKMKTGGYLVYPTEVENVLAEHEAVDEVAVVGIPDPQWGDRIEAAITLKPGASTDGETLRAFCRDRIASFKVPKRVVIWEQMPKGPTGKIQKLEVIERLSARDVHEAAQ